MKKILVTGGAGFIGSHLCERLLERGDQVICIDNFNDFYSPARKRQHIAGITEHAEFALIEGDIRDAALVDELFQIHQPTHVAHLAAMANPRYSIEHAPLYAEVNVQGTTHILESARHTESVENILMASTSSIYGRPDEQPFREDMPVNEPLAPYPATKKACELMGHAYHHLFDMNVTVVRYFNAYGPRVRPDTIAWIVMKAIRDDGKVTIYNQGDMFRDWTYIADIVDGTIAALDTPLGYEIINLGRGEPQRLGDFVDILHEIAGDACEIVHAPAPGSDPPLTYASIEKANRLLRYQPTTSIEEGLRYTWQWFTELEEE